MKMMKMQVVCGRERLKRRSNCNVKQRKGRVEPVQLRKWLVASPLMALLPGEGRSWGDTPASPVGVSAVRPQDAGHHCSGSRKTLISGMGI